MVLALLCSLCELLLQHRAFRHLGHTILLTVLIIDPLLPLVPLRATRPATVSRILAEVRNPLVEVSSSRGMTRDALTFSGAKSTGCNP